MKQIPFIIIGFIALTFVSACFTTIWIHHSMGRGGGKRRTMWEYNLLGPFKAHRMIELDDEKRSQMGTFSSHGEELMLASIRTKYLFHMEGRERKVYSQNGEDGILEYIFDNLGTTDKFYVEFGVETCTECNTRYLWEAYGWDGVLMDGSGKSKDGRVIFNHLITSENIVSLLESHKVPRSFDLLCVDLDFNDYYVAKSILKAGFRPRVVVQEVNRNWGVDESYTVVENTQNYVVATTCSTYWGMSQLAAYRLYSSFGYVPVYVEKEAVNMFFIHEGAIVDHLHTMVGATGITARDVKNMLSPTFQSVYRRQDTTLCKTNSFFQFREHDLKQPDQVWKRVGLNGLIAN